jgi:hypothetical protein
VPGAYMPESISTNLIGILCLITSGYSPDATKMVCDSWPIFISIYTNCCQEHEIIGKGMQDYVDASGMDTCSGRFFFTCLRASKCLHVGVLQCIVVCSARYSNAAVNVNSVPP